HCCIEIPMRHRELSLNPGDVTFHCTHGGLHLLLTRTALAGDVPRLTSCREVTTTWSVELGPRAGLFQTTSARCMPLKGSKQPSATCCYESCACRRDQPNGVYGRLDKHLSHGIQRGPAITARSSLTHHTQRGGRSPETGVNLQELCDEPCTADLNRSR